MTENLQDGYYLILHDINWLHPSTTYRKIKNICLQIFWPSFWYSSWNSSHHFLHFPTQRSPPSYTEFPRSRTWAWTFFDEALLEERKCRKQVRAGRELSKGTILAGHQPQPGYSEYKLYLEAREWHFLWPCQFVIGHWLSLHVCVCLYVCVSVFSSQYLQ